MSLRTALWTAVLCALLLGSVLYIGSHSFALGTLLAFAVGPVLIVLHAREKHPVDLAMFAPAVLGVLMLFAIMAAILHPTYPNFQYLKAFGFAFLALPIIKVAWKKRPAAVNTSMVIYALIIGSIAVAQLSYLYLGFGWNPIRADAASYVTSDQFQLSGVRSVFSDPNVFATVCLLIVLIVLYRLALAERTKAILAGCLAVLIVFAASRICIVVLALVLINYYLSTWRKWKYVIPGICIAAIVFVALSVYSGHIASGSYWLTRISSIARVALNYAGGGLSNVADQSVDLRISTYMHFLLHFGSVGFGSLQAQDYSYFLSQQLMRQDPHSLMVELTLLYGYPGFLAFCFLIAWVYKAIRRSHNAGSALVISFCVFMLTFTSSSEINFPTFWILLFILCSADRVAVAHIYVRETDLRTDVPVGLAVCRGRQ